MGKLKLEARHRVEQNQVRGHEIIEYAEQKLEEARQINSSSHLPIFDLDEDEDFNYTKDSRLEANGVCGKGGISESSQILAAIEAIDLDDVTCLFPTGRKCSDYSVSELVEMFGISENAARSLLAPRDSIDVPNAIAESETDEVTESVFDDADLCESAEPFNGDLSLNETTEFSDEELERMVYELKHAFD